MRIETQRAVFATALIAGFLFGLGACNDSKTRTISSGAARSGQLDRMGKPAINTVLVKSARKDEFNRAQPRNDAASFTEDGASILNSKLGLTLADGRTRTAALLTPGDVLTYDPTSSAGYEALNGRKLSDDVIDISLNFLALGTTTGPVSDNVNGSAHNFSSVTFPYLAKPRQPTP
jgi:hypothetical protein